MAHDLTAAARRNSDVRQADAAAISGLQRFRDLVAQSRFSTNIDFTKVGVFDAVHEVLDKRSTVGLANFAAGPNAVRRESFEDLWVHGRRFVYGAVNAGGMGAEGRYGPICLVMLDPEQPVPDALAVFPGDSVELYTVDGGVVDEPLATAEVTAWPNRADLAIVVLEHQIRGTPERGWAAVVCRAGHYLEVTRAGVLPLTALAEVRLRRMLIEDLDELQARFHLGEALDSDEKNMLAAYDVLQKWRRDHGVALVPAG